MFRDIRFPTDPLIGMQWVPDTGVRQIQLQTGRIVTVQEHATELWRATLTLIRGPNAAETIAELLAFLRAVYFERDSFRVRKHDEYQVARQEFATGSGTGETVQLSRSFTSNMIATTRNVVLPTVTSLWADNVLLNPTASPPDYIVDADTGLVTFAAHLGDLSGQSLEWAGSEDLWMKLAQAPAYESISTENWRGQGIQLMQLPGAPGA